VAAIIAAVSDVLTVARAHTPSIPRPVDHRGRPYFVVLWGSE
jgi:hypothetical protein